MRRLVIALVVFLAATSLSTHSNAQTTKQPQEIGIGTNWLVPTYGDYSTDEFSEPTGHIRFTMPFARHFAFEGIATVGRRNDDYWTQKAFTSCR